MENVSTLLNSLSHFKLIIKSLSGFNFQAVLLTLLEVAALVLPLTKASSDFFNAENQQRDDVNAERLRDHCR